MKKKIKNILLFSKYIFKSDLKEIKKKNLIFLKPKKQFYTAPELLKLIQKYNDIDAIVYGDDQIDKSVIRLLKSKGIKLIIKWGIGLDSIDLSECHKLNIKVKNTPGVFSNEVGDMSMALLLSLIRKIPILDENTRKCSWEKKYSITLNNKTVGIIGYGAIGKSIEKRVKSFGTIVHYYDKIKTKNNYKNINSIFSNSDIIFISTPLNQSTENLINKKRFSNMKKKPFIVNVARGGIVNEKDIIFALKNNLIRGYATDVYEEEPVKKNNKLLRMKENVVLTNHTSSLTIDGIKRVNNIIKNYIKKIT